MACEHGNENIKNFRFDFEWESLWERKGRSEKERRWSIANSFDVYGVCMRARVLRQYLTSYQKWHTL